MDSGTGASKIIGIETANPDNGLTQEETLDVVRKYLKPSALTEGLYQRFLMDKGIRRRFFAWENPEVLVHESVDDKMRRFERSAVDLAVKASQKVLEAKKMPAQDIKAVFVCTCTGYLCPGLSTYVSQRLGLASDVYTLDLVGLGCTGALPTLKAADDYLKSNPGSVALVIAVEICSAATHWGEKVDLILSNAIFSDGAAAALLTNRSGFKGLAIKQSSSLLWPEYRDELRFKYQDSRLCNVISSKVPDIVARAIKTLAERHPAQSAYYAFHSGGRKVLDALQQKLALRDEQIEPSRRVLREYGNMSSPSVLFVLKELMDEPLKAHDEITSFSFGAGFLAYMLRTQWQDA